MTYEELQIQHEDLNIVEMDLSGVNGLKGLYVDGNIAVVENIPEKEKACILAEELGHYYTTTGDILDQTTTDSRKQERKARIWAYNKQIGLLGIVKAYQQGCRNRYEAAEYLGVTEEFLDDALKAYRSKYGIYAIVDNYIIYFEPAIGVMEIR